MAIKTKEELFGPGTGAPNTSGWVPVDPIASISNSPFGGALLAGANRGINTGEGLTAAVLNRASYALAINDETLQAEYIAADVVVTAAYEAADVVVTAAYEAADVIIHSALDAITLDVAYDKSADGALVKGAGRVVIKDAGAVETVSVFAAVPAVDDRSHFRANQYGDTLRGGGGFESVAKGYPSAGALFGMLDRRSLSISNYSWINTLETADLLNGTIQLTGGGRLREPGTNYTDLIPMHDFIEVQIAGSFAGLYAIQSIDTDDTCTVVDLGGAAVNFGSPATAASVRFFRGAFGSFNKFGHVGTLLHQGVSIAGFPGQDAALEIVAGSTLGRYAATLSSLDGARYALRARWKNLLGVVSTKFEIDSMGQVRSYVASGQLTAAQRVNSLGFGAPAFVTQQDRDGSNVEVGFLARHNSAVDSPMAAWHGFMAATEACVPVGDGADGLFTFTYETAAGDILFTNGTAADDYVNPFTTFIEIVTSDTPGLEGIYAVGTPRPGPGHAALYNMAGSAVSGFPTTGGGTARILSTTTFGRRHMSVITALDGLSESFHVAGVIQAPRQQYGTALLLEGAGFTHDSFLLRGSNSVSPGVVEEVFALDRTGHLVTKSVRVVDGLTVTAGPVNIDGGNVAVDVGDVTAALGDFNVGAGEYLYTTPRAKKILVPLQLGISTLDLVNPVWEIKVGSGGGNSPYLESNQNGGYLAFSLNDLLRDGMYITEVEVVVQEGVGDANPAFRMQASLGYTVMGDAYFAGPTALPVPTPIATWHNPANSTALQRIDLTDSTSPAFSSHQVNRTDREYWLYVNSSIHAAATADNIWGIRLTVTDPGPRNV